MDFTPKAKFSYYRRAAKYRNIFFDLTIRDIIDLWKEPCAYCKSAIQTVGIDRIDSSGAYERCNVVPCCVRCNWMKRELSVEDFLAHCKKIVEASRFTIQ